MEITNHEFIQSAGQHYSFASKITFKTISNLLVSFFYLLFLEPNPGVFLRHLNEHEVRDSHCNCDSEQYDNDGHGPLQHVGYLELRTVLSQYHVYHNLLTRVHCQNHRPQTAVLSVRVEHLRFHHSPRFHHRWVVEKRGAAVLQYFSIM